MNKFINKISFIISFILILSFGCSDKKTETSPIPENSQQIILLIAENPDTSFAFIQRYEKSTDPLWKAIGDKIPVSFGRNGLAWGQGLHPQNIMTGLIKKEGDGKSPAGIFTLGKVMGYSPQNEVEFLNMPYEMITDYTECIDDIKSPYYNQIILNDTVATRGWTSSERMWRYTGWYDWLIPVNHNCKPIQKGDGSCIFIHIRMEPDETTAGCTVMDSAHIYKLIQWLDNNRKPLLIQLTREQYNTFKEPWKLP